MKYRTMMLVSASLAVSALASADSSPPAAGGVSSSAFVPQPSNTTPDLFRTATTLQNRGGAAQTVYASLGVFHVFNNNGAYTFGYAVVAYNSNDHQALTCSLYATDIKTEGAFSSTNSTTATGLASVSLGVVVPDNAFYALSVQCTLPSWVSGNPHQIYGAYVGATL